MVTLWTIEQAIREVRDYNTRERLMRTLHDAAEYADEKQQPLGNALDFIASDCGIEVYAFFKSINAFSAE